MQRPSPPQIAMLLSGLGIALHLYTTAFKTEGGTSAFVIGMLVWSCLPYAVTLVLARFTTTQVLALGAAAASVVADAVTHYLVFVAPQGSTAALGLLFAPLWNLIAFGPIGALAAWAFHRLARRADAH